MQSRGLHFRHTDNINFWLRALEDVELPRVGAVYDSHAFKVLFGINVIHCDSDAAMYYFFVATVHISWF